MTRRLQSLFLLAAICGYAGDFRSGQAARAVIGQNSFSAHDGGIDAVAMSISTGRLFVADVANRLFTFDLTKIPGATDPAGSPGNTCGLCGFAPIAMSPESVLPRASTVSIFGNTVAVADARNHQVLIWFDASAPGHTQKADVVLGGTSELWPISASTLAQPVSVAFDGKRLFVADAALHRVLVWNALPRSDNRPADAVLGQPNFTSASISDTPGSDTLARPTAVASDGTNVYVGDQGGHRVLMFSPGDVPLSPGAISNSASLAGGPVAPGTLITITGSSLSTTTETVDADGDLKPLPTKVAGMQVVLDGAALPILSVSPTEIRSQIPYDLGGASAASLYVKTYEPDGSVTVTNAIPLTLIPASPGLFGFAGKEPRSGMVLHSANGPGKDGMPVTPENPAKPGEILTLWAAGMGSVTNADSDSMPQPGVPYQAGDTPVLNNVEASVNGQPATVLSAVLPHEAVGIYVVRIELPDDLPPASSQIQLIQNGQVSNAVTFAVQSSVQ